MKWRLTSERGAHWPITVVVNVTAADASSFRASQGQIAADMARAIDPGGAESLIGAQFLGAMNTVRVLPS